MPLSTADVSRVASELNTAVKEGAYVAVGLGVLAFQRAQAQSAEVRKRMAQQVVQLGSADLGAQLRSTAGVVEEGLSSLRFQLQDLARSLDERWAPARHQIDQQLDRLEHALPGGARDVVQSVRTAAETRQQLLRSVAGLN